jgi:sulfur carrier protein
VTAELTVVVNGRPHAIADGTTLTALIEGLVGSTRGSAAAVDGEVVPRSQWSQFRLGHGQSVEVLTAVQGG